MAGGKGGYWNARTQQEHVGARAAMTPRIPCLGPPCTPIGERRTSTGTRGKVYRDRIPVMGGDEAGGGPYRHVEGTITSCKSTQRYTARPLSSVLSYHVTDPCVAMVMHLTTDVFFQRKKGAGRADEGESSTAGGGMFEKQEQACTHRRESLRARTYPCAQFASSKSMINVDGVFAGRMSEEYMTEGSDIAFFTDL